MLTRVILHVGPSKTGTTTIQNALAVCRGSLKEYGFFYPDTTPSSKEGQPSLAWDILSMIGRPVAYLTKAYVSWENALEAGNASGCHTLLISSEDFTLDAFDVVAFARLREIIGDLEFVIVFALRDPAAVVPSMWQQAVKWGCGLGEEVLHLDAAIPLIVSRPRIRVINYIEQVEAAFEQLDVRMFTVPPQHNLPLLLRRFADAAHFPSRFADEFSRTAITSQNQSLPVDDTALLLKLNQVLAQRDPFSSIYPRNGAPERLYIRGVILDILAEGRSSGSHRPLISVHSAAFISEVRDQLLEWLKRRAVIGDLDDLSSSPAELSSSVVPHPSDRLVSLLVETIDRVSRNSEELRAYLCDLEAARDWWRGQAEAFESATMELRGYLSEVEAARDRWRLQAENLDENSVLNRRPD